MKPSEDWPRVKAVLEGALQCEDADRAQYLAKACGTDTALRAQIERLLAVRDRTDSFLETPAAVLLDGTGGRRDLSGSTINSYRLVSRLGSGGMGDVYLARDARLNRDVAVKVLPDSLARDPDRIARFEREAQLLASLNHPHIGSIYGFEQSGNTYALILELVDGPTLADRIAQGPLGLDEALPIARQIVEAVETAHDRGVVHRDLKPANIKLRPDGTVKVLDFGLAKAFERGAAMPVMTPNATEAGVILGTPSYMSPEQARGKLVDKRSDIWAFGCVLYEMLTGRRPFEGEDTTEVLAHIIEREPDFDALPASTPPSIRRLLRRCFEKDRTKRLPDIGVARIEIDEAVAPAAVDAPALAHAPSPRRAGSMWMLASALILVSIVGVVVVFSRFSSTESRSILRASIALADRLDFGVQQPSFALSPDGTRVVYLTPGGGPLRSRLLNEADSSMIPGTEGASNPFFSPDGKWLAFFAGQTLRKVSFAGGAVITVATLPSNVGAQGYRGGSWSDDGTIAFAPSTGAGLFRVSDQGGEPTPLTTIDPKANETAHRWPHFLPGGKAVLFTVKSTNLQSFDDAAIRVRSLETGEEHAVAQGNSAQYLSTGHLVYARAGALFAMRFDPTRLTVTGAPIKVADSVITHPESGAAQAAVSRTGTLVFAAGGSRTAERPLLWVDRNGNARSAVNRQAPFWWPRISPDGRHVAVVIDAAYSRIWVLDVERGTFSRASQLPGDQDRAIWMPDGVHVTFAADTTGSGAVRLYSDRIDGTGSPLQLLEQPASPSPLSWSPDGRQLLYRQISSTTGQDVWIYSADDKTITPFLASAANEFSAAFSPDGHWVAYVSDESGRTEVYVRPFPGPGPRSQISNEGGTAPVWSRDGREIFFAMGDTLYTSPVSRGATFSSGAVQRLFSGPYSFHEVTVNYDVAPDGQRFLVPGSRIDSTPRQLELVLNWSEEVNRLVPK